MGGWLGAQNPSSEQQLAGIFQEERSSGMRELISVWEKIKQRTLKAMSTTMEEENSERDHFEEVRRPQGWAGQRESMWGWILCWCWGRLAHTTRTPCRFLLAGSSPHPEG
jgi:hypothetical protein